MRGNATVAGTAAEMGAPSRFPPSLLLPPVFLLLCGSGLVRGGGEVSAVTCGSVLKLLNTRHSVRLHSHEVKYGSGKTRGAGRAAGRPGVGEGMAVQKVAGDWGGGRPLPNGCEKPNAFWEGGEVGLR